MSIVQKRVALARTSLRDAARTIYFDCATSALLRTSQYKKLSDRRRHRQNLKTLVKY